MEVKEYLEQLYEITDALATIHNYDRTAVVEASKQYGTMSTDIINYFDKDNPYDVFLPILERFGIPGEFMSNGGIADYVKQFDDFHKEKK